MRSLKAPPPSPIKTDTVPTLQAGTTLPDDSGSPGVYTIINHVATGGMAGIYLVDVSGRKDGPFILKVNHKPRRVPEFYREAWWQSHGKPGVVP